MLNGISLIFLSLLAVPSLILKRRPDAKEVLDKIAPYQECKLVRCTRGAIYDVIIDLRSESPTFKQHVSVVLNAQNRKMLYVPKGFAHGLLTLEDDTEIFYQMSEFYAPGYGRGVRWDDPAFGIQWPEPVRVISEQDRNHPGLRGAT